MFKEIQWRLKGIYIAIFTMAMIMAILAYTSYHKSNFFCGISKLDYLGKLYGTVKIGNQCWLSENLNVGIMIDSSKKDANNNVIEKYCYNNDTEMCNRNGGLYQWNEAMQYSYINATKGICPDGWHIPTDNEWYTLERYLTDSDLACDSKRDKEWSCYPVGRKLRLNEFKLIFAGVKLNNSTVNNSFANNEVLTSFWSSDKFDQFTAWGRHLNNFKDNKDYIYRTTLNINDGWSVRCLLD